MSRTGAPLATGAATLCVDAPAPHTWNDRAPNNGTNGARDNAHILRRRVDSQNCLAKSHIIAGFQAARCAYFLLWTGNGSRGVASLVRAPYPRSDRPERKGADLHRRRKVPSLSQALPQAVRMAATS